ncbi:MAG: AraC family transcriptional regulator [Bacteroidota bacterium]
MKAAFEHIEPNRQQSSFTAYRRKTDYFDFHWHYHPEMELTLIEKGNGTRLVGDHTESFLDGDLVLLGSNLPHTWVSESKREGQSAIVIQFRRDLIADAHLELSEFTGIKRLFSRAHLGIFFDEKIAQEFHPVLSGLLQMKGLSKLTSLWHILDSLGRTRNFRQLASPIYRPMLGVDAENRIDRACQYIHDHFTRKIPLNEMSNLVGMTETSFCRFFKKMTGKSFTDYVNDLRISRARKLLAETEANISEIAFASGFESMTHFNRIFLKKNGMPPREYRVRVKSIAG